jgi:hypothetical protein
MMYVENPLQDLHDAMAHAQYEGFSDINYERMDYDAVRNAKTDEEKRASMRATVPATRRLTTRDFNVYAMFPQTWGSTALGHGGMGGAAMTTAYTIVLECYATREFLVYFGGQVCYKVNRDSVNFNVFIEDCKNHKLVSKRESSRYGN